MANRERGEVELIVGERTYTLVLDIDAMCALEEYFSTPTHEATWDEIEQRVQRGASVRMLRALIWAMLQRHHPDVTIVESGRIVSDMGGLPGLITVVSKAMRAATPDPEDVKALGGMKAAPPNPRSAQGASGAKGKTRGVVSTLTPARSA